MTEAEWFASSDPERMLCHFRVRDRRGPRKLRLYAVACCRRIWHLIPDSRSREVVEVAERYADGGCSDEELGRAAAAAEVVHRKAFDEKGKVGSTAEWCVVFTAHEMPFHVARTVNWMSANAAYHNSANADEIPRVHFLRDIFGNFFHPAAINPAWRAWKDGTVVKLAQAVYDEREIPSGHLDAGRMASLADALEESGCTDQHILAHCRGPGPHVRGCWVVDLLLGKE